jgi:hypothetical protein
MKVRFTPDDRNMLCLQPDFVFVCPGLDGSLAVVGRFGGLDMLGKEVSFPDHVEGWEKFYHFWVILWGLG